MVELGVLVCIQFQPWALEVGCPGGTTLPERRGIFRCASCDGEAGTVLPLFSFFFFRIAMFRMLFRMSVFSLSFPFELISFSIFDSCGVK